jgi:hypothetical protein
MISRIETLHESKHSVLLQFFRDVSRNCLMYVYFDILTVFQFVVPNDIRTLLSLRTTEGRNSLEEMPPSLQQCMVSFTQLHQTTVSSFRRGAKPSLLTVGGKAFCKHVHRDLEAEFWGVCKGSKCVCFLFLVAYTV